MRSVLRGWRAIRDDFADWFPADECQEAAFGVV